MEKLYKYPKTPHMPFSETITSDDKKLNNMNHFNNREIVITEKMDGENTTIYRDYYHARSLDSIHRDYHSWLLLYMRKFQYILSSNARICGEYLYAKHSIEYNNLLNYFQVFSIWEDEKCLDWESTKNICDKQELTMVPELYIGIYNEDVVKRIAKEVIDRGGEGIVIRSTASFNYDDFDKNVAKYVRANHVQTDEHWTKGKIERNKLFNS